MRITREMAATARCPLCEARAGESCVHVYGRHAGHPRARHHEERVEVVRRWELQHQAELELDRERARG